MPKNIVQDVVPKNEKSIRQIPIPERQRASKQVKLERHHMFEEKKEEYSDAKNQNINTPPVINSDVVRHLKPQENTSNYTPNHQILNNPIGTANSDMPNQPKKKLAWLYIGFSAIIILILLPSLFSKATVIIHPKQYQSTTNIAVTASTSPSIADVLSSSIALENIASINVPATGEKFVEKKASGTIVVFNNHSELSQRLIINTRFETPGGLIYRIPNSIVVPGSTIKNGRLTPGSIETGVIADDVGDKYNIGLTDFTIPGFKNSDKYATFYARSKTPMTGGFSGMEKIVDKSVLEKNRNDLRTKLENETKTEIASKVPDGYFYYPKLTKITFESITDNSPAKNEATVKEKIIATGIVLNLKSFANILAVKTISDTDNVDFELINVNELGVSFKNDNSEINKTFEISVNGTARFLSSIDSLRIATLLAGNQKSSFNQILTSVSGIEKAEAAISPFWKRSFPKNTSKINVILKLD